MQYDLYDFEERLLLVGATTEKIEDLTGIEAEKVAAYAKKGIQNLIKDEYRITEALEEKPLTKENVKSKKYQMPDLLKYWDKHICRRVQG